MAGSAWMVGMATITLITSHSGLRSPTEADRELEPVRRALAEREVRCDVLDWRAASELSGSDLVVIKSPWDYARRVTEFVDWLGRVESQTRVVNHPRTIRWNLDKHYLGELAEHGVAVCPTVYCGTLDEVRAAVAELPRRVVLKPTVSASSANTGLFEPDDPGLLLLARQIVDLGKQVMVQPALDSIGRVGERSLIHFDGRFVHAVGRSPLLALGGGLLGTSRGAITPVSPASDERELAEEVLAVAGELMATRGVTEPPVHARVDLARDEAGRPVLMELELFEPSFFLELAPGAERHYADVLLARLDT
ncbi:ATP-grasp domain-containing protein [Micropruina sp.]|uniref:ATP-grasp domain-containing protein n=1 Tax=Micropruina sp. TaxID=2737536 RepID=UPI0039E4E963